MGKKQENIGAKGRDRRDLGDEGESPPKAVLRFESGLIPYVLV